MKPVMRDGKVKLLMQSDLGKEIVKALGITLEKGNKPHVWLTCACISTVMCVGEIALYELVYGRGSSGSANSLILLPLVNILICYSILCYKVLLQERRITQSEKY